MGKPSGAAHVARVVRKYKDREYVSWLLRRSYRDAGKVKHQTLANLSALPAQAITDLRASLAGRRLVDAEATVEVTRSLPHGHVAAVWAMARKLGLPALVGSPCPERDLAMALLVARVVEPGSKLATTRWWADTTLGSTWASPMPPPTRCTPPWTGWSTTRSGSSGGWPAGT